MFERNYARSILIFFLTSLILWLSISRKQTTRTRFAVVQYATDRQYLCNALINVVRLRRMNTVSDLVVFLPEPFLEVRTSSPINRIVDALQKRNVRLIPLDLTKIESVTTDVTYQYSLQKLNILKLPYERILFFDNDGLVLKNVDHLFVEDREVDLVMPEAYYAQSAQQSFRSIMSSAFMLIRPSSALYQKSQTLVRSRSHEEFDMEIFNRLFFDSSVTSSSLSYRHNLLLTGIFRDHTSYVRNHIWDAQVEIDYANYVHFSDAPIPKPWIDDRGASFAQHGPKCSDGGIECPDVRIWRGLYNSFRNEMRELCPSTKELDR